VLGGQPGVEGRRRDPRIGPRQQDVSGHLGAEGNDVPTRDEPEVLATGGERAACHVDQILGLRCGELGRAALRSAGRDLCEDLGDVCYCDGLDEERGGTVATPPLRVQPTTIPAKS